MRSKLIETRLIAPESTSCFQITPNSSTLSPFKTFEETTSPVGRCSSSIYPGKLSHGRDSPLRFRIRFHRQVNRRCWLRRGTRSRAAQRATDGDRSISISGSDRLIADHFSRLDGSPLATQRLDTIGWRVVTRYRKRLLVCRRHLRSLSDKGNLVDVCSIVDTRSSIRTQRSAWSKSSVELLFLFFNSHWRLLISQFNCFCFITSTDTRYNLWYFRWKFRACKTAYS